MHTLRNRETREDNYYQLYIINTSFLIKHLNYSHPSLSWQGCLLEKKKAENTVFGNAHDTTHTYSYLLQEVLVCSITQTGYWISSSKTKTRCVWVGRVGGKWKRRWDLIWRQRNHPVSCENPLLTPHRWFLPETVSSKSLASLERFFHHPSSF